MLINSAWAASSDSASSTTATTAGTTDPAAVPNAPSGIESFAMVLLMVVLFYVLLIRPQQKRFKDHSAMLSKLDKGTKIVTQGGLVGTIEKEISDHELLVDFGNGVKISTMRSAIMGRYEDALPKKGAANDDKKAQGKAAK